MNERSLPSFVEGYGSVAPFDGSRPSPAIVTRAATRVAPFARGREKLLADIESAFVACGIADGATLSFHHHLRNGDQVLNQVLAVAARRGLRDLTVAASSIFPVHAPLIGHLERGVVTRLTTAYMSGPVAEAVSRGVLQAPVVMTTHGGRARAIESGELHIDVAFIAAPAADRHGNLSGGEGRAACGPLGYAMVDAGHADRVVAITDQLCAQPPYPVDIAQDQVDFVVLVDSIGDPQGILSGTTRPTTEPVGLLIASSAAQVIAASGLLVEGFSLQTGAGGISIATSMFVQELMQQRGVVGSFGAGGVTGTLVEMLEAGLFRNVFDVQCFDLRAVQSYRNDARHLAMSASMYANPHSRGPLVERLDAMLLGAAEVDLDFNVNVTTASSGVILGGSGGHADTAAGARLAIVTTRLSSSAGPKIVERVRCLTTPGETIDAIVTEAGVAVNSRRADLRERLLDSGLDVLSIETLHARAREHAPEVAPTPRPDDARVVAVVEYRDGRVTDVIRRVER
jgi:citrate lyase subunit alpha/citrate CoA-transferase